jgi:hypothetical protein
MNRIRHIMSVVQIVLNYLKLKILNRKRPTSQKKRIYFDFNMIRGSLFVNYHNLISLFLQADFEVCLIQNIRFIGQMPITFQVLLKHPNVYLSSSKTVKSDDLIFSDNPKNMYPKNQTYTIDFNYFDNYQTRDAYYFPFSIHPGFINNTIDFKTLRSSDRRVKIFFAGNTIEKAYNNQSINQNFKINNRFEIIEFIKENLGSSLVQITNRKELEQIEVKDKIVLATFEFIEGVFYRNESCKIPRNRWFESLSMADFWICAPGVVMPHCHNNIEAMSVGCIPILQYEDLFSPHLKHNENCIIYKDLKDLKQVLLDAINTEENKIAEMRRCVIEYYETYLSPTSQVKNFLTSEKKQIKIIGSFLSVEILQKNEKQDIKDN